MKKRSIKVLSLFLALTLLIGVVSPLSAATAKAVGTPLSSNSVLSFESGEHPEGTSGTAYHKVVEAPGTGHGSYSLYREYSGENLTYRIKKNLVAGHTYNISGYYYFSSNTENRGTYTPWFDIWAGSDASFTSNNGVYNDAYNTWHSFNLTYTAMADADYIDLVVAPVDAYFDDIYIADYTKEQGVYVNTDFSDIETAEELPILAGNSATVSYEYDSELEKNIAVAQVVQGLNADSSVYLPFYLKDQVSYEVSITYKTTAWACISYAGAASWDGDKGAIDSTTWTTKTYSFTGSGDNNFFRIGTTLAEATIYISSITLREVNNAKYQFYDFESSKLAQNPVFNDEMFIEKVPGANGRQAKALRVANSNSAMIGWYQKNYMSDAWGERLLVGHKSIVNAFTIGPKYNEYAYYGFDIIFQDDVPSLTIWIGNAAVTVNGTTVSGTSDGLDITTEDGTSVLGTQLQPNVAYTFKIPIQENSQSSSAFGIAVPGTGTFLIGNPYFEATDGTITSDNLYIADGENASVAETSGKIEASEQTNLRATLDYSLVKGRQYRISYDYIGNASLRFMVFNGSDWESVQPIDVVGENQISLASSTWARHEAVFTAADDSTDIWFLAVNGSEALYIDNLIIEQYEYEAFDTYKMDFENGVPIDGGCGAVNYTVTAAPADGHGQYSMKHSVSSQDEQYYFSTPRLVKGHTYTVSLKYYAESSGATRNCFVLQRYQADGVKVEDYNTETVKNKWVNASCVMKASTDGEYLALLCRDGVYFDDIVIVDITNTSGNYMEDFSAPSENTTLFQTSELSTVTYAYDESLGKTVAKISYSGTMAAKYGWVGVPFVFETGSTYRVSMTYKAEKWHCPYYNGTVNGDNAIDVSSEWTTKTWEITGSDNIDYFAIGTNQDPAEIYISNIAIDMKKGVGDLDNNGAVNTNDLGLQRKYLVGQKVGNIFQSSADTNRDNTVNSIDLVRLKRMLQEKTPVVDACDGSFSYLDRYNVFVDTSENSNTYLGDGSRIYKQNASNEAYLVYKIPEGIAEFAIQYDAPMTSTGNFTVKVSPDPSNPYSWQEVTADDVAIESINGNSWVKVTEYFGDLNYFKGLRIELPAGNTEGIPALRKVQVNALDEDALYEISGYNSKLREAQTIYVDSKKGNDDNSGLTIGKPLKTLSAAFARTFVPGDKILLATDGTYSGSVKISSSGTEFAPITISSYGTGANPVINGFDDGTAIAVSGEYVEISNIDFTCEKAYSAVDFYALKDGATMGLVVKNCNFYNINSLTTSTYYDMSNGAVHFLAEGRTPTWFEGILVENNTFKKVARTSIHLGTDWAARDTGQTFSNRNLALEGAPVYLSTDVIIRNNKIQENSGDAIVLIGADGALVEHNTVADSKLITNPTGGNFHWVAVWCHSSDNCVFQYNEIYGNSDDNNGKDLQAFDIDVACHNSIVQYNYTHDNAGGFIVLCAKDKTTNAEVQKTIVRYNLSVNDGSAGLNVFDITGNVVDSQIYNNTVYCGKDVKLINFANYLEVNNLSTTTFTNNVFYSVEGVNITYGYGDSATPQALQSATFNKNVFYYVPEPVLEGKITVSNSEKMDPKLVNAGVTGVGRFVGVDYKPQADSYALTSGTTIENNGGKDYFGKSVSNTLMGAFSN